MITRDGVAKVLDFGLAKLTEPLGGDGSQAQTGLSDEIAVDAMHQILRSDPPPVKEISPETPSVVRRLIRRTLAKDPEQRFQSMPDLAFELSDLAEEDDALSVPTDSQTVSSSGVLTPITDEARGNKLRRVASIAAAVMALGSVAFWLLRYRDRLVSLAGRRLTDFDSESGRSRRARRIR